MENRSQSVPLKQFDHGVNVVGHEAPCQKPVALVVEVQEGILDKRGDIISIEPAGAQTRIELPIDLCRRTLAKTSHFSHVPGQVVGKPERHELRRLR